MARKQLSPKVNITPIKRLRLNDAHLKTHWFRNSILTILHLAFRHNQGRKTFGAAKTERVTVLGSDKVSETTKRPHIKDT